MQTSLWIRKTKYLYSLLVVFLFFALSSNALAAIVGFNLTNNRDMEGGKLRECSPSNLPHWS